MVNTANLIEGRKIKAHPLEGGELPVVTVMRGEVQYLAAMAVIGGVINTEAGQRRFQAGDYVITDDPPTNAWIVNAQAFRAQYRPPNKETPPHVVPAPAESSVNDNAAAKGVKQRAAAKTKAATPKKPKPGPAMRHRDSPEPPEVEGRTP